MPVALTSVAIQCPSGPKKCNTYFYAGVVQGDAVLYVANNGARLTTLARGKGIEIATTAADNASKVSLTGDCTETTEAVLQTFPDANWPSE